MPKTFDELELNLTSPARLALLNKILERCPEAHGTVKNMMTEALEFYLVHEVEPKVENEVEEKEAVDQEEDAAPLSG